MDDIAQRLQVMVATRLKVSPALVPLDDAIIGDLGLESIEVVEMLLDVEAAFPAFDLASPEASNLRTLRDLAAWLAEPGQGP